MTLLKNDARLLFLLALSASVLLWDQINWIHYFVLFWIIDVFGYWPGYLTAKFTKTKKLSPIFYYLYNSFHSVSGLFILCSVYLFFFDNPQALLAPVLHLSIDRGLLGNFLKGVEEEFV